MINYKMTKEQWNEIISGLKKFMEDRRLTPEMQREGFLRNIIEELHEYAFAEAKVIDDISQIDAICDICVFALNTLDNPIDIEFEVPGYNPKLNLLDMVLKVHTFGNFVGDKDMTIRTVKELFYNLVARGYDPYLCMLEVIKEINSRTGDWNEDYKKFIKHNGAYHLQQVYDKYPTALIHVIEDYENKVYKIYKPKQDNPDRKIHVPFDINEWEHFYTYAMWYKAQFDKCELNKK